MTARGNFIDLVVDIGDVLICIENKVHAPVYNELGDYRRHCESISDGRAVLGVVLSPHEIYDENLKRHEFRPITYRDIVNQLRRRVGDHLGLHNVRYQYLFFDFTEQAARFTRRNRMDDDDQAFLDFWRENEEKISDLQAWIDHMGNLLDANGRAEEHREQCLKRLPEQERSVFRDKTWNKQIAVFGLADDTTVDGCGVFLDVSFHPFRVTHVLGKRRGLKPDQLARAMEQSGVLGDDVRFESHEGRQRLVTEESPLNEEVREKAVETSVAILKYIAKRHAAENG